MRPMRQNSQLTLPFTWDSPGESGGAHEEGTEAIARRNPNPNSRHARPGGLGTQAGSLKSIEPPCTDPYARWCGRVGAVRPLPIPMDVRQANWQDIAGESPVL